MSETITKAPRVKQIIEAINMPNNSAMVKWERKIGYNALASRVFTFSATPFSAESVMMGMNGLYPYNEVVMNIVKRESHGNTYELYVLKGGK